MIFPDLEKKRRIQKMKEDLLDLDSSGRPLLYETPLTSPVKETSPFQFPPSYQMMDTNNDDGNFSVPSSPFDGPRITTTSPGRGMGMGSMRQPAHHHHQLSYSSANGDGESPHSANSYTSASSSPTRPSFPFPLSINTATADNKKD